MPNTVEDQMEAEKEASGEPETLDSLTEAFEANENRKTAEALHLTARQHFNDGKITEDE